MSRGSDALSDVHRKLDWATGKHDEMLRIFEEYLKPGGGNERPCGVRFRWQKAVVVAFFNIDEPMPDAMSMLAADLVHNTRTALDHILARLKDHLGGDPGQGSFPTSRTEKDWQGVVKRKNSPLDGLPPDAVDLVYNEQPLHRAVPAEDPLVILNKLDNDDKHRMLSPAFVYTDAAQGVDLIEVLDPGRVKAEMNLWTPGTELEDGTRLARYIVEGDVRRVLAADDATRLAFATGKVGSARTSYVAMIDRVRDIAKKAERLIDSQP
jgi:hypothetical protein